MDYTCCRFVITNGIEAYYDVLSSMLCDIGFDSFEQTENHLDAYIPSSQYSVEKIDNVIKSYPLPNSSISYCTNIVANKDWNSEWESQFQPISIHNDIYIHSSSYSSRNDVRYDIILNPRMSFGSGSHITTRLMLKMMLQSDFSNKAVLDLGCGTGILGILARMLNCTELTCLDIDSNSIINTNENMSLNGLHADFIAEGSIDILSPNIQFDTILSNIHLNIHLSLMPEYYERLRPEGELLISGFYKEDLPPLDQSAKDNGFIVIETQDSDGWVAMRCIKKIFPPIDSHIQTPINKC